MNVLKVIHIKIKNVYNVKVVLNVKPSLIIVLVVILIQLILI